jgi:hypothetical protein
MSEINNNCDKCPIIVKEIGIVKVSQEKLLMKVEDIYKSLNGSLDEKGWLTRIVTLEEKVTLLEARLKIVEESISPTLARIEDKIDRMIK